MPYYVYAMRPFAEPEQLAEHAAFKDAAAQAKALRGQLVPADRSTIRVMFAGTALEAEDLLLQIREPRPAGEE